MMMMAESLGLASCWVGGFDPAKVREAFNLPSNYEPVCILPVGYRAPDAEPSPLHAKTKPLDELVFYGTF